MRQTCHAQHTLACAVVFIFGKTIKEIHSLFLFLPPRLTLGALGLKLNDYWKEVMEKRAREREFQALDRDENEYKHDDK